MTITQVTLYIHALNLNVMKKKLLLLFSFITIFLSTKTYADCTLNADANASSNPLNGCSGIVTINAKLTMDADYNLSASGITQFIISTTGEVNWNSNNVNLSLPANCQLIIQSLRKTFARYSRTLTLITCRLSLQDLKES